MNEKRASWRIVCDINGEFRVEVLDKPINWWYIAASKMGKGFIGYIRSLRYVEEHFKNTIQ